MKSNPRVKRKCPECGQRKAERQMALTSMIGDAIIKYGKRFPYVSNAFPFKGKGAKHVGPMGKLLVENKRHEDTLRHMHGYVSQGG